MRGGMDPVLWAERMKGRMDQVHLKDWGLIGGEFAFRALGEGRINWPAVVKACKKAGVTPDFLSWPYYGNDPDGIISAAAAPGELFSAARSLAC